MPGMTGIGLYEAVCAVAPDQADRMLFMTGGAFSPEATAFLDARPDRVLEKPFDRATLMAALAARVRSV